MNVFTVTVDKFNVSLLNENINLQTVICYIISWVYFIFVEIWW